jgi:hypothetical protein
MGLIANCSEAFEQWTITQIPLSNLQSAPALILSQTSGLWLRPIFEDQDRDQDRRSLDQDRDQDQCCH